MATLPRWDPCISHRGSQVSAFINDYFASVDRAVFLVGGAGFDPRSTFVSSQLAAVTSNIHAVFLRENRPNPDPALLQCAEANTNLLVASIAAQKVVEIEIFGRDGAVIGGRNAVRALGSQDFNGITDVVIDISALSVGTSFPIIRYFVERAERGFGPANIHIFVAHEPELDASIRSVPSDTPSHVHGFKGGSTLDSFSSAARLWLPQLAPGRRAALARLFDFVGPHDTCPILPFPARNPRLADELAEDYLQELESTWTVDTRNIVYADESDPLDLYRTILRLDDRRKPVFAGAGGSLVVLSPLGSKVMALGALMAALERDLPVAHVEPISYSWEGAAQEVSKPPNLVHIWLEGEVYPAPRPVLRAEGAAN